VRVPYPWKRACSGPLTPTLSPCGGEGFSKVSEHVKVFRKHNTSPTGGCSETSVTPRKGGDGWRWGWVQEATRWGRAGKPAITHRFRQLREYPKSRSRLEEPPSCRYWRRAGSGPGGLWRVVGWWPQRVFPHVSRRRSAAGGLRAPFSGLVERTAVSGCGWLRGPAPNLTREPYSGRKQFPSGRSPGYGGEAPVLPYPRPAQTVTRLVSLAGLVNHPTAQKRPIFHTSSTI